MSNATIFKKHFRKIVEFQINCQESLNSKKVFEINKNFKYVFYKKFNSLIFVKFSKNSNLTNFKLWFQILEKIIKFSINFI
jgi:hypothetical protein